MRKIIYIILFVAFLTSCSNNDEKYYNKPIKELRQGELYKGTYEQSLFELENGTFDDNFDFWVKRGEGSIEELILASKYNFRPVSFIDIKKKEWEQYELAVLDAIDYYFRNKYGENFWEKIEDEAISLNKKYNVIYYDTLIPQIIENEYKRIIVNDSIEIGLINKTILDSLPFYIIVDTISSINTFKFAETEKEIVFRATKRHYKDTTKYLLPTVYLYVFWDTNKTDFPYCNYPLAKVILN